MWCGFLNLTDFEGFCVSHTANTGNYNVNFIYPTVANIGNVSFEILTNMPVTVYPSAGAPGIRVYLTNSDDETYTDANKFVVLPSNAGEAWFDTLSTSNTFAFTPDGERRFCFGRQTKNGQLRMKNENNSSCQKKKDMVKSLLVKWQQEHDHSKIIDLRREKYGKPSEKNDDACGAVYSFCGSSYTVSG